MVEEKIKRIPGLDKHEALKEFIIRIPDATNKRLNEISFEKEISKGAITREAIRRYLTELENPIEPNPEAKVSDEDLTAILDHCTTFFGGFNIDGEDGFIESMLLNNFKLQDLVPEQFDRVLEKLVVGYRGYFSPPDNEEWLAKLEELEPTKEQLEKLKIHETTEEED